MPRIVITAEAEDVLRKRAQERDPGFTPEAGGALPQPNGCFSIPLTQETVDGLSRERAEGETYSDVIIRLAENEV